MKAIRKTKTLPCVAVLALALAGLGCGEQGTPRTNENMIRYATMGLVERLSPELNAILSPGVLPEQLAAGFDWSEGPVWIADGAFLLFSDVPQNKMYRWAEGDTAATIFLDPSGLTSSAPWTGSGGSNGLTLDAGGYLVIAQHGDRRVSRLDQKPGQLRSLGKATFTTIADRFQGNRLQSPNDVVFGPGGDLYFTDPPYGLEGGDDSELREIEFNGVYRVSADGEVHLLDDLLSRPNGIAFSPDGRTMYVSNSDPDYAVWIAYDVDDDGSVANRRVFFDASSWTATKPGLPDGLKVDSLGNIFATGPGGVLVFAPDGRHLGTIVTGTAVANCAFGDDGRTLYMTSDDYLTRIRVLTGAA